MQPISCSSWTVHGERTLYDSEWVRLALVDVEIPQHRRFEHHVVRVPLPAVGVVVVDPERGVLLMWRHRFITDTWGWEVPAGRVEAGEDLEEAAIRETVEETGWGPGPLHRITSYHPSNGLMDQTFHLFVAEGAVEIGAPTDRTEADHVEWMPVAKVREILRLGEVRDGMSMTALAMALLFEPTLALPSV